MLWFRQFKRNYGYLPLPPSVHDEEKKRPLLLFFLKNNFLLLLSIFLLLIPAIYGVFIFWKMNISPEFNPLVRYQDLSIVPVTAQGIGSSSEKAVVTTLYSDDYAYSVAVLGHSLRSVNMSNSSRMLLLYIPNQVSSTALCVTAAAGWQAIPVNRIPPPHNGKGIFWRFADQYTKLRLWSLDTLAGVKAVVYLDGDTLVRKSFEELFDLPFSLSAVPDVFTNSRGFVSLFNAGVLSLQTNHTILDDMLDKVETAEYPPTMAEQAFLNRYYSGTVNKLPYAYNANLAIKKKSPALWDALKSDMRIVHYTLRKPAPPLLLDPIQMDTVISQKMEEEEEFSEEFDWWHVTWKDFKARTDDALAKCFLD